MKYFVPQLGVSFETREEAESSFETVFEKRQKDLQSVYDSFASYLKKEYGFEYPADDTMLELDVKYRVLNWKTRSRYDNLIRMKKVCSREELQKRFKIVEGISIKVHFHDECVTTVELSAKDAHSVLLDDGTINMHGFYIAALEMYGQGKTYKKLVYKEQECFCVFPELFILPHNIECNNVFEDVETTLQMAQKFMSDDVYFAFSKEQVDTIKIAFFPHLVQFFEESRNLMLEFFNI